MVDRTITGGIQLATFEEFGAEIRWLINLMEIAKIRSILLLSTSICVTRLNLDYLYRSEITFG
jgi:hypothetical protein